MIAIKKAIHQHHGFQHYFKAPQKWVYPLPQHPAPPKGINNKHFILVCEDMHVHRHKDNIAKWKGVAINKRKLSALFIMLRELGLSDSVYPFNIPFSKDGKITFIDTEYHHDWPVPYHKLTPYLSPRMKLHWKNLIKQNGP